MLENHLLVEIRYAREQVPHGSLGLRVDFFLCLGQLPVVIFCGVDLLANLLFGLFKNGPSNMVAHAMNLQGQILDVVFAMVVGVFGPLRSRKAVKHCGCMSKCKWCRTYRNNQNHSILLSRELLASVGKFRIADRQELEARRGVRIGGNLL